MRKRHPDGGGMADGISPRGASFCLLRSTSGSGIGMALIRPCVYGCAGDEYSSFPVPTSTSLPRYITPIRSDMYFTTARS